MEHSESGQNIISFHLADGCQRSIQVKSSNEAHLIQGIALQVYDYLHSDKNGLMILELSKQPPFCKVSSEEGKWDIDDLMHEGALAPENKGVVDVEMTNVTEEVVKESSNSATEEKLLNLDTKKHDQRLEDKKIQRMGFVRRSYKSGHEAKMEELALAKEAARETDAKVKKLIHSPAVRYVSLKAEFKTLQTRYDLLQRRYDDWQTRYDIRTKMAADFIEALENDVEQRNTEIHRLRLEIHQIRRDGRAEVGEVEEEMEKRRELAGEVVDVYIEENNLRGARIEELESMLDKHKIPIPAEVIPEGLEERRERYIQARRQLFYTGRLR